MKIKKIVMVGLAAFSLGLSACTKPDPGEPVKKIAVSKVTDAFIVGDTVDLDDYVNVEGGKGEKVYTATAAKGSETRVEFGTGKNAHKFTILEEGSIKINVVAENLETKKSANFSAKAYTKLKAAFMNATGNLGTVYGFEGLNVGKKNNVIVDRFMQTSAPDVFAGGDVVTGPKFAIDAIAAGKEASISIHRYVHPGQTMDLGRDNRDYKALDVSTLAIAADGFDTAPRQKAAAVSGKEAKKTMADLRGNLTEEQIKKEAARCLGCGAVVLDEDMCIGCGICTTKCKFDAIHLEKCMDTKYESYHKTLLTAVSNIPQAVGRMAVKKIAKK